MAGEGVDVDHHVSRRIRVVGPRRRREVDRTSLGVEAVVADIGSVGQRAPSHRCVDHRPVFDHRHIAVARIGVVVARGIEVVEEHLDGVAGNILGDHGRIVETARGVDNILHDLQAAGHEAQACRQRVGHADGEGWAGGARCVLHCDAVGDNVTAVEAHTAGGAYGCQRAAPGPLDRHDVFGGFEARLDNVGGDGVLQRGHAAADRVRQHAGVGEGASRDHRGDVLHLRLQLDDNLVVGIHEPIGSVDDGAKVEAHSGAADVERAERADREARAGDVAAHGHHSRRCHQAPGNVLEKLHARRQLIGEHQRLGRALGQGGGQAEGDHLTDGEVGPAGIEAVGGGLHR